MKRIAVIDERSDCPWLLPSKKCCRKTCPLESLASHDEAVRADERKKCFDCANAYEKKLEAKEREICRMTVKIMRIKAENDALLAERSAVRAAAIDEMVLEMKDAGQVIGGIDVVRWGDVEEIAERLKEGK